MSGSKLSGVMSVKVSSGGRVRVEGESVVVSMWRRNQRCTWVGYGIGVLGLEEHLQGSEALPEAHDTHSRRG